MYSVVHRSVVHCVDVFTRSWTRTNPNSLILSRFFSVAACFMVRNNESLTARALSKLSGLCVVSNGSSSMFEKNCGNDMVTSKCEN